MFELTNPQFKSKISNKRFMERNMQNEEDIQSKESMQNKENIEQEMYRRAIAFIPERYPKGWGGAAVIRTEDGQYFVSVAIETANGGASLCIEVGAMCEAHKYNVCV